MISREHNCIFVHIPKTGGSSIESMIWPAKNDRNENNLWMGFVRPHYNKYQTGGLQHLLARQIKEEVGEQAFSKACKFSMVRDPWDKAVSQYVYMAKRDDLREFLGMSHDAPFTKYLELIARKKHVQWAPQYEFVLDENGEQLVDQILRFERFNSDVSGVLRQLNIHADDIAHRNRGVRGPYEQYYDRATQEQVKELYARDIELFGYEFISAGLPGSEKRCA